MELMVTEFNLNPDSRKMDFAERFLARVLLFTWDQAGSLS